jgi:hypothetical protein
MAAKVVSFQDGSPRFLLSVFNDYQGEIGDLHNGVVAFRGSTKGAGRSSTDQAERRAVTVGGFGFLILSSVANLNPPPPRASPLAISDFLTPNATAVAMRI